MNLGEISAMQLDQPKVVRPEVVLNKQLQQDGLKLAVELQQSFVDENQHMSDNRKISARILGISINQSLTIEGRTADVTAKNKDDEPQVKKPLFDFEEVAVNVLNFVGSVIKKASSDGASYEKLNALFEQARYGVSKGIKLAEKELGANATAEIKDGIAQSRVSIADGMQALKTSILDKVEKNVQTPRQAISRQNAQLSEFSLRTKGGDEVRIRFGVLENTSVENLSADGGSSQSSVIYEYTMNFALQIKGEINQDELRAIGDLVAHADDVVNTFYRGDIDKVYDKAIRVGFDNKELASYALQLSKAESSHKIQKYGEVQQYSETPSKDLQAPRAVAEYLNKVLDGMNQAAQRLNSQEDFKSIINSLVNEMKDVQVPDILGAINRFHTFNTKLMDNLQIDAPSFGPNKKPAE